LKEALETVTAGMDSQPVQLVLKDNEIHLRCSSKDENARISVPATVPTETPKEGFYYNIGNLSIELFDVVKGKIRVELDAKGTMIVKTANEVYLQLSQRAPVSKKTDAA
jgi:hypothetical protein